MSKLMFPSHSTKY